MNTFNQLKLGIVTLASIGMIAACGGGSSSGSSSAAGAKAAAPSTCPTKIQFALREFLTDESAAKLASGASMQGIDATENLAWVLVSEEGDFWHHNIYINEDGTFSSTDEQGATELTLVMYGTQQPTQVVRFTMSGSFGIGVGGTIFEEEDTDEDNSFGESYGSVEASLDVESTIYDIFGDLNFAYVNLNEDVDESSIDNSVLRLNRDNTLSSSDSNVLSSSEGLEIDLFPKLLDITLEQAVSVLSGDEDQALGMISYDKKHNLILDLAKAVIASEDHDITNFKAYGEDGKQAGQSLVYNYDDDGERYTEVEIYYNSDNSKVFEDSYSDVLSDDYIDETYTMSQYGDDESLLQYFSYREYDDNTPENYEYSSESIYYWGDEQEAHKEYYVHPNGIADLDNGSDVNRVTTYNQEGKLIYNYVAYKDESSISSTTDMYDNSGNHTIMSQRKYDSETYEVIETTYYSLESEGNLQELTDQDKINGLVAANELLDNSLSDSWSGMMSEIQASREDVVFNYKEGLAGYLNQFSQLNAGAIMMYDGFKSGTLPLNKTDLSQACLVKVMKDVPLDGDDNEGIAPVEIINLSNNKTVTVEALKAMLEELETNGKGESIISIDVRNTSITADQAKNLMDTESMLSIYEVLGITLIHDGMDN